LRSRATKKRGLKKLCGLLARQGQEFEALADLVLPKLHEGIGRRFASADSQDEEGLLCEREVVEQRRRMVIEEMRVEPPRMGTLCR
jgi:hypothetical protein